MLVQTLLNSQIETLRSFLEPVYFPLKNFRNRPEMQCLGFNLTEIDVLFNKGYVLINTGYEEVKLANSTFCSMFEDAVK